MKLAYLSILLALLFFSGCTASKNQKEGEIGKWAFDLANTVMARNDSLIIYNNPSSIKWQYDIAMLGQAIYQLRKTDSKYKSYYKSFIDFYVGEDGSIKKYKIADFSLDNINPAKGLLTLYEETGDEKYLKAIEQILQQLQQQPRTLNRGYWHKKIYPRQIWLNSAYMVAPFMAQYAKQFNQPQWYDSACFQLDLICRSTRDPSDGLLVHAWDETKSQCWADPVSGKSPSKWGRGMGWYIMALVDVLEYLPESHPDRKQIEKILKETSRSLLKVRDKKSKLWYQVLDKGGDEFNYIETSCSAMIIYAYAKGSRMGVLPSKYHAIAVESFQSLVSNFIRKDKDNLPTLTNICGQAGLGGKLHRDGSFQYYINQEQIDNDPKGIAPLIMAAIELNL